MNRSPRFKRISSWLLGGISALCATIPFFASLMPSRSVKSAGDPIQVDLSQLSPGQKMSVEWRGKPIWIIRRTPDMLKQLAERNNVLRDPNSDESQQPAYAHNQFRSIKSEYLVLIGLCTHLGCIPKLAAKEGDSGFYCPCHGSHFDIAGRVYKNVPASQNLAVPPYHFIRDNLIVIGESA